MLDLSRAVREIPPQFCAWSTEMSDAAVKSEAQPWSAADTAKALMRIARRGSLATLDAEGGGPYASLVGIASDFAGAPLLLLSTLARHTRNLAADSRASILLAAEGAADPLADPRVSLQGRLLRTEDPADRRRYLARHPEAAGYAGFADFGVFRLEVSGAHLVAGFGRIVDLAPAAILSDVGGAEQLLEAESGITEHMNDDHADAVALYATKLLGAEEGAWSFVGCDPEGCEIALGAKVLRLPFPRRATTSTEVRVQLVELVRQARVKG
jgi:putative heme iron utilization protein